MHRGCLIPRLPIRRAIAGADRGRIQPGGAAQDLELGTGRAGAVVAAVPVAGARCADPLRAGAQPDARRGASRAAPGAGAVRRRCRQPSCCRRSTAGRGATRREVSQATSPPAAASTASSTRRSTCPTRVDAFGATERELEGLQAQVDSQRFQVEAAVPEPDRQPRHTAIQEASLRAQLQATREIIAAAGAFAGAGATSRPHSARCAQQAVLAQRTQLAQARADRAGAGEGAGADAPSARGAGRPLARRRRRARVRARRALTLPQELPLSLPRRSCASGPTSRPAKRCCTRRARRSASRPRTSIRRSRCRRSAGLQR